MTDRTERGMLRVSWFMAEKHGGEQWLVEAHGWVGSSEVDVTLCWGSAGSWVSAEGQSQKDLLLHWSLLPNTGIHLQEKQQFISVCSWFVSFLLLLFETVKGAFLNNTILTIYSSKCKHTFIIAHTENLKVNKKLKLNFIILLSKCLLLCMIHSCISF